MEPDVRLFLATIVQSMSYMLLWLLLNTYFGIKLELLFLDEKFTIWHVIYYLAMVSSFIWVIRLIIAKCKKYSNFSKVEE